jgi:hypothetical protein
VGIGTASPTAKVHVSSPDGTAPLTLNTAGGSDTTRALNFNVAGDNYGKILVPSASGGAMAFWTGSANAAAERARIDSSGNVGIGTSSPSARLSVSDTANPKINLLVGTTERAFISYTTATTIASFDSDGDITLSPNNTEAVRVNSFGNLLVGTTSSTYKLHVKGSNDNSMAVDNDGSQYTSIWFKNNGTDKGAIWIDNTAVRLTVRKGSSGGVYLTENATAWTGVSDERKKDIIEPISDAANKVSSLRAVIGKYKTDDESTRRSFLIAQDVQKVLPEAVDASNPDELGIAYTDVIPLLVAAIQEQQALITTLTDRITALEAK